MKRPDDSALTAVLNDQLGWPDFAALQRELLSKPESETVIERLHLGNGGVPGPSVVVKSVPKDLHRGLASSAAPAHAEAAMHEILLAAGAPLPELLWRGWDSTGQWHMMVSEDVALRAELGTWGRCWSGGEMNAVMRAVARFHGAGHGLVRRIEQQCDWVSSAPPCCIDGAWLGRFLSRVPDLTGRSGASGALRPLERVCDRYDFWKKKLRPYETVIHRDIFMGNVAVRRTTRGEVDALILDVEMAVIGLPQLDVAYCSQRGWQTDCDWETLRAVYRRELATLYPAFTCDDAIWQWGYRLALLQLKLWWHVRALPIAEAGAGASEQEQGFLARGGGLCNAEFLENCDAVLQEEPWG